ncbi:MAG: hypothetical protein JJU13_16660 [Balneolaceae bacterium]|nr:hypothetical protein [Balneolaceae bacterium]
MIRLLTSFFIILSFLMISCTTEADSIVVDFGADYSVLVSDDFPTISDNELNVEVLYTGCEPNHEFNLEYTEINENEFEVWLNKLTPNEDCEDSFQEVRVFTLPGELEEGKIIFLGPNIEIVLKESE